MKPFIEELDYQPTRMGELILRKRRMFSMEGIDIYEVKFGDEYLMSSLFHVSEVALVDIGLGELSGTGWDVVVGGLGLGYTAVAALKFSQLKRLVVVEAFEPVIDWHRKGLVPNGNVLNADNRCLYHQADFFSLSRGYGFDPNAAGHAFDAILVDIDHTPDLLLDTSHGDFYTEPGMIKLKSFLKPYGIFALWSNDPPQDAFLDILSKVFDQVQGHPVAFENILQQNTAVHGIYVARA